MIGYVEFEGLRVDPKGDYPPPGNTPHIVLLPLNLTHLYASLDFGFRGLSRLFRLHATDIPAAKGIISQEYLKE